MSELESLLTIQKLDLESDKLIARRASLPEREAIRGNEVAVTRLDAAHQALLTRCEALGRSERTLSAEVAEVAAKAKEVEDNLYSGSVRAPKELEALQEEIRLLKEKQSEIEEREMGVLEEIDATDAEAAENRAERQQSDVQRGELEASLAKAEQEIDDELGRLATQKSAHTPSIPEAILTEYERLRGKPNMGGRAAARLEDGVCGGCQVKLPVLEYNTLKTQPPDALITCVHCYQVLVR